MLVNFEVVIQKAIEQYVRAILFATIRKDRNYFLIIISATLNFEIV